VEGPRLSAQCTGTSRYAKSQCVRLFPWSRSLCVILERSEESRILASPLQGEADARHRASGEGPNSKFRAVLFCVILSAAKDLDGRSDDRSVTHRSSDVERRVPKTTGQLH